MRIQRTIALAVFLLGFTTLAACGGGAEVNQHMSTVSQGQELEDLKKALDQGAITQDEYNKLQLKILKRGY
jgi:hypothetical protein